MDAEAGAQRLCYSRRSLLPHICNDRSIMPPYSIAQISEEVFDDEVAQIVAMSSQDLRRVYARGKSGDRDRSDEDNWVMRWFLHYATLRREQERYGSRQGQQVGLANPRNNG